jgi:hypothetical protein
LQQQLHCALLPRLRCSNTSTVQYCRASVAATPALCSTAVPLLQQQLHCAVLPRLCCSNSCTVQYCRASVAATAALCANKITMWDGTVILNTYGKFPLKLSQLTKGHRTRVFCCGITEDKGILVWDDTEQGYFGVGWHRTRVFWCGITQDKGILVWDDTGQGCFAVG